MNGDAKEWFYGLISEGAFYVPLFGNVTNKDRLNNTKFWCPYGRFSSCAKQ